MAKFLIEVPHGATLAECIRAVEVFLGTGSHFLTHADWGCRDGDHRAWIKVEAESHDEARNVVPPHLRAHARIIQLNTFCMKDIEDIRRQHNL